MACGDLAAPAEAAGPLAVLEGRPDPAVSLESGARCTGRGLGDVQLISGEGKEGGGGTSFSSPSLNLEVCSSYAGMFPSYLWLQRSGERVSGRVLGPHLWD